MTVGRLLGIVCVRNEADRYLRQCLAWHGRFLDDIFVYDDRSNDDSARIAAHYATLVVRDAGDPAFMDHEGQFRQAAWEAFEIRMQPSTDDWVLAFDADEFLCWPRSAEPGSLLRSTAQELGDVGQLGCRVKVNEVFDVEHDGTPMIRIDGYWGDIHGVRFFRFNAGGRYANRKLGCGSAPSYAESSESAEFVEFLHYGYATSDDRVDKHNRYFGVPGHSAQHIESIITAPTLTPWTGLVPS